MPSSRAYYGICRYKTRRGVFRQAMAPLRMLWFRFILVFCVVSLSRLLNIQTFSPIPRSMHLVCLCSYCGFFQTFFTVSFLKPDDPLQVSQTSPAMVNNSKLNFLLDMKHKINHEFPMCYLNCVIAGWFLVVLVHTWSSCFV